MKGGRRRGRSRGAREGAYREGATTLHPWTLRVIRNADAFAATRPTLLVRRGLAVGLQKEKTQKLAVHAGSLNTNKSSSSSSSSDSGPGTRKHIY